MDKLKPLARELGYQFTDQTLLILALTHRSRGSKNYERLEFLGDSILGFVVAEWLYKNFSDLAEGKLSRMRSALVRKETLAHVARDLKLGSYLILGVGELKSGGFNRDSILSDAVESLIGAIYLDSDFSYASEFIFSRFEKHFSSVSEMTSIKDAKSQLQEAMQKHAMELPNYTIIDTSGEQHEQQFSIQCTLPDLEFTAVANATTRRLAEQKAAESVLFQLYESLPAKFKKPKQSNL